MHQLQVQVLQIPLRMQVPLAGAPCHAWGRMTTHLDQLKGTQRDTKHDACCACCDGNAGQKGGGVIAWLQEAADFIRLNAEVCKLLWDPSRPTVSAASMLVYTCSMVTTCAKVC